MSRLVAVFAGVLTAVSLGAVAVGPEYTYSVVPVSGAAVFSGIPAGPYVTYETWCDAVNVNLLIQRTALAAGVITVTVSQITQQGAFAVISPFVGTATCYMTLRK